MKETDPFDLTKNVPVIYRCRACERAEKAAGAKRPRVAFRVVYERRRRGYQLVTYQPFRSRTCGRQEWIRDGEVVESGSYESSRGWPEPPSMPCPKCGTRTYGDAVRGTLRPEIPCSAKCTGAVGPSCDCACGGINHGGAHG